MIEDSMILDRDPDKLKEFTQKIQLIFQAANEGLWEMDKSGKHTFFNRNFYMNLDIDPDHCFLEDWVKIVHPDDQKLFKENVHEHIGETIKGFKSEYRVVNKDGADIWLSDFGIAKYDENMEFEYMIGSHSDITEQKTYEEKILKLAYYDNLTGLMNRLRFEEILNEQLLNHVCGSLVFVNIKNFKKINEAYGMEAGDELLITAASCLSSVFSNFLLARYTGDEFVVFMEKVISMPRVDELCHNFLDLLSRFNASEKTEINLEVSIGVIEVVNSDQDIQILVQNARLSMKKCKSSNRHICYYNEEVRKEQLRQVLLETYIKRAIECEELYLKYQPIISLTDFSVTSFEALVRWKHPTLNEIYPSEFIPISEENYSIIDIGLFVLRKACEFAKHINEKSDRLLTVAVNISGIQIMRRDFSSVVYQIVKETSVNPKLLVFEITESVALNSNDNVLLNIRKLQKLGIKFALDDYGTGYSSLNMLIDISFDIVKIDKSITWKLVSDESIDELIEAVVKFCKKSGKKIVFEGVENLQMRDKIIQLGGNFIQGYLYSRPLLEEDVSNFLATNLNSDESEFMIIKL